MGKDMAKRIGILTAGSDCPGLNAAIRAIGKAAQTGYGMEVIAFQDGFQGLVNNHVIQPPLSGILTAGGTILGTSRDIPSKMAGKGKTSDQTAKAIATYREHNLDALICIGGQETHEGAFQLMQQGLNIITLPKGVDNDLAETDQTIGFDTALSTATEAIDRLHSTASSHHRIIVVEIMGRNTGWLTLGSGIAGGADVIIIPEIPYDVRKISDAIFERTRSGKRFSIIAVSEGAISKDTVEFFERSKRVNRMNRGGEDQEEVERKLSKIENNLTGSTIYLANRLQAFTSLDTRITILGHLLRGGTPSAADRVLATNLGTISVRLAQEGIFGVMVATQGSRTVPVPLDKVVGRHKLVSLDHPWIENARSVGTHLGD
jgi:ATP-dependent phosphofructokinase / diphosphate-dependent phosphofructokinase